MATTHKEYKTVTGSKVLPFMKFKWLFILISILSLGVAFYEIGVQGLNFGVDFIGGNKIVYDFDKSLDIGTIRKATEGTELDNVQITPFGADESLNQFILRAKYIEGVDAAKIINKKFNETFGADKYKVLSQEVVGPKVGADLKASAIKAFLWASGLILLYIAIRFDFLFAPGAIVALLHDVIISVGFFAYFGKEFNLPILAAVLTIVGYSINDTIIIYDRVRENIQKLPRGTALNDILDISLTETLRRTIVTSLTILIVVIVLFFLGGGVLHDFAFCLIIGVIFGTYSSIFIASPIYLTLAKFVPNFGMAAKKEAV